MSSMNLKIPQDFLTYINPESESKVFQSMSDPHSSCTLNDIAKAAGVTKMTVSRALSGGKNVKKDTLIRILRIADEMGYQKNPFISTVMSHLALQRGRKHPTPLLLLLDWPEREDSKRWYSDYINGAKRRAESLGFETEIIRYNLNRFSDRRLNEIIETRAIEGLIINVGIAKPRELNLNWQRLVAVTTGGRLLQPRHLPRIQSDTFQSLNRMVIEAQKHGYKRIGFCLSTLSDRNTGGFESVDGFQTLFCKNFIQQVRKKNRIPIFEMTTGDLETPFKDWFFKTKPDLVISSIPGTLGWLRKLGMHPPRDVGFMSLSVPELTSKSSGVHTNLANVASSAVDTVVSNLMSGSYGTSQFSSRTLVPGIWHEGSTIRKQSS